MPSSHLNHQVRQWGGVQNGQNLIVLYKENIFLWTMTSNSLKENEEHYIPLHILKTIFCMPRLFFRAKYVWFPVYL